MVTGSNRYALALAATVAGCSAPPGEDIGRLGSRIHGDDGRDHGRLGRRWVQPELYRRRPARGDVLSASCGTGAGQSLPTTLDMDTCVTNSNGQFAWQVNGGYAGSCNGCSLNGTVLTCNCYPENGPAAATAIDTNTNISNCSGTLTCGPCGSGGGGGEAAGVLCQPTATAQAESAIQALQNDWFSWGNWSGTAYWHQANLVEALSNYAGYTHDTTYNSAIAEFFLYQDTELISLLTSQSYDDVQWVALSWLRADDIAPSDSYLQRALTFYNYASTAWDSRCGGGLWWSGAKNYKNAITNELYIVDSMKLYEKTGSQSYLNTAQNAWAWFAASGMINSSGLINDGLDTATCQNNGQTVWTYNQGVILGGLAKLSAATGDGSYVDQGAQIIDAVLSSSLVTSEGILQESCEPSESCDEDQYLFKGIFVRYLGYFLGQAKRPDLVAKYSAFLATNVASIWNHAQSSNTFDNHWSGPFQGADAQTQGSALDALSTAVQLSSAASCP